MAGVWAAVSREPGSMSGSKPVLSGVWFPTVRTNGGVDIFTEQLVAGLQSRGVRAEIAWLPLRAEYAPWSVRIPELPSWASITHINTWLPTRFVPVGVPLVATVHHCIYSPAVTPYKGVLRSAYHHLWVRSNEKSVLKRADMVTAVSNFAASTVQAAVLDRSMRIIYNGIDATFFKPVPRGPRVPFRLLYVGKWAALKGIDLLRPIMRELGAGFELRVTAGGALAQEKGIYDLGRLTGRGDVAAAMQDADALIFPSRAEGFGLVVAEAMACGLPVIATRGSALPEIVEDGVTGLLCASDDVSEFACAIRRVAGDRVLYRAMSSAARCAAEKRFSLDRMVDDYLSLYGECVREV